MQNWTLWSRRRRRRRRGWRWRCFDLQRYQSSTKLCNELTKSKKKKYLNLILSRWLRGCWLLSKIRKQLWIFPSGPNILLSFLCLWLLVCWNLWSGGPVDYYFYWLHRFYFWGEFYWKNWILKFVKGRPCGPMARRWQSFAPLETQIAIWKSWRWFRRPGAFRQCGINLNPYYQCVSIQRRHQK